LARLRALYRVRIDLGSGSAVLFEDLALVLLRRLAPLLGRDRTLDTRLGSLQLRIPKLRQG